MPSPILEALPLGFPWVTFDPFLFCVHHDDPYPKANGRFGPAASLSGHAIGQDFQNADGWRMYHGEQVPGFPGHPHRGFETVTVVRRGLVDHSDSLGAAARYGGGDTQWLTAGAGVVHSEMFPLLDTERPNPMELFQIWLNLPAKSKFAKPHFTMFWGEDIPRLRFRSEGGPQTELLCVAGAVPGHPEARPLAPPPDSWASRPEADVAIWTLRLDPGAQWTLPPATGAASGTRRCLYFFAGGPVRIAGQQPSGHMALVLDAGAAVDLVNDGDTPAEFLLLQGRPIGEPVVQYGPFVMNTEAEVRQAFADYRRTQFGGWPWPAMDPVHGADPGRFARHADGHEERRGPAATPAAADTGSRT